MIAALRVKGEAIHVKKHFHGRFVITFHITCFSQAVLADQSRIAYLNLSMISSSSKKESSCYNFAVLPKLLSSLILGACVSASAQQPAPPSTQPQVKVNMINACTPSADDQKELSAALAKVPKQPSFAVDYEVDRGRSTLDDNSNILNPGQNTHIAATGNVSSWVRIRKEMAGQSFFSTVQYSFSVDPQNMIETLVLRVRDPKDLMQLAIEDDASAVTSPTSMLATNTPVTHIRLERFGKSSIALARCTATEAGPAPDQSAYEPIFKSASDVVAHYRGILNARAIIPDELTRIVPHHKMPVKGTPKEPMKKQN